MRRWIRLDADWEEDEWLHAISGEAAGCWPRLLCWVKLRGQAGRCRYPSTAVLAHTWRVSQDAVVELLVAALDHESLAREDGDLIVANWVEYQEPDRTAADRKRRQREKEEMSRDVTRDNRDVGRDPSMSMSMSGVAVEGKESEKGEEPKKKRPWRFCPADWTPSEKHHELAADLRVDLDAEEGKFRDHEFKDPKTDADRAFSRWLRNAKSYGNILGRPDRNADASTRLRAKAARTAEYLRNNTGAA